MTRYQFIAESEPYASLDVLAKYGYQLTGDNITTADIGMAVEQMVGDNGEPALKDIMAIHPDKGIILELFAPSDSTTKPHVEDALEKKEKKGFDLNNPSHVLLLGIGVLVTLVALKS